MRERRGTHDRAPISDIVCCQPCRATGDALSSMPCTCRALDQGQVMQATSRDARKRGPNVRKHFAVCSLLLCSLLIAGCGDDNDSTAAKDAAFSLAIVEPKHLTPPLTNESEGSQVLMALFSPLVEYDTITSEPTNLMAESIELSDEKVWTITIKDGWTFHNGEPVTAASFVNAWNYTAHGSNAANNAHFFERIAGYDDVQCATDADQKCIADPTAETLSGLEVLDDHTFRVTLKDPFSQFPLTLGYNAFYPLPTVAFEDMQAYEKAPIGNGPFEMDGEWRHDEYIRVTRYENYAGTPAKAEAVEFRIYTDMATAYREVQAGNLDISKDIPPEVFEKVPEEFGDRYIFRDGSIFNWISFPLYDERFANPDLRRAISMAIDRDTITREIFSGTRSPARSLISPVVFGARKNPCGQACEYHPEEAKALFDKAGGFEGTFTLWYSSGSSHDLWIEAVGNYLRQNLGITDIKYRALPFAEYLEKRKTKGITGPFRAGWIMDYPSPQSYLEPLFTYHAWPPDGTNDSFYRNPAVDQLIREGNAAATLDQAIAKYQQAEDLILADMPVIPAFFRQSSLVHSKRIENAAIDAFDRIRVSQVEVIG